jgi:hypothetical protein
MGAGGKLPGGGLSPILLSSIQATPYLYVCLPLNPEPIDFDDERTVRLAPNFDRVFDRYNGML